MDDKIVDVAMRSTQPSQNVKWLCRNGFHFVDALEIMYPSAGEDFRYGVYSNPGLKLNFVKKNEYCRREGEYFCVKYNKNGVLARLPRLQLPPLSKEFKSVLAAKYKDANVNLDTEHDHMNCFAETAEKAIRPLVSCYVEYMYAYDTNFAPTMEYDAFTDEITTDALTHGGNKYDEKTLWLLENGFTFINIPNGFYGYAKEFKFDYNGKGYRFHVHAEFDHRKNQHFGDNTICTALVVNNSTCYRDNWYMPSIYAKYGGRPKHSDYYAFEYDDKNVEKAVRQAVAFQLEAKYNPDGSNR